MRTGGNVSLRCDEFTRLVTCGVYCREKRRLFSSQTATERVCDVAGSRVQKQYMYVFLPMHPCTEIRHDFDECSLGQRDKAVQVFVHVIFVGGHPSSAAHSSHVGFACLVAAHAMIQPREDLQLDPSSARTRFCIYKPSS